MLGESPGWGTSAGPLRCSRSSGLWRLTRKQGEEPRKSFRPAIKPFGVESWLSIGTGNWILTVGLEDLAGHSAVLSFSELSHFLSFS